MQTEEGSQDRQAMAHKPSGKTMRKAQRIFPVAGKGGSPVTRETFEMKTSHN